MKIPKGFIKESSTGLYKRNGYVFDGKHIVKESTILPNEETAELIDDTKLSLDDCIKSVLATSDLGQPTRPTDVYIDKSSDDNYIVSDKRTKNTVAIVAPDNNVYYLKFTEIPEQTDTKELAPEKGTAEPPKEEKTIETKPKELDDLKEGELLYTKEVSCKDDSIMFTDDVSDFEAILQFVKDYAPAGTKPQDCTVTHFDTPIPSGLNSDGTFTNGVKESDGIKTFTCPKCGKKVTCYPALSRFDNKTEICSDCGTTEAFENLAGYIVDPNTGKVHSLKDLRKESSLKEEEDLPLDVEPEVSEDASGFDESTNVITGISKFVRLPSDLNKLVTTLNNDKAIADATYTSVKDIELSPEDYDSYTSDLRQPMDFLKSFNPPQRDTDFTCLRIISPGRPELLISNSGFANAQYVSIKED